MTTESTQSSSARNRKPALANSNAETDRLRARPNIKLSRNRKRRRPRALYHDDDMSFLSIVMRVAIILFCICTVIYIKLFYFGNEQEIYRLEDKGDLQFISESGAQHKPAKDLFDPPDIKDEQDDMKLPVEAAGDCFELAEILPTFQKNPQQQQNKQDDNVDMKNLHLFLRRAESIRAEFAARYGGEVKARAMLSRGLSTFHDEADDFAAKVNGRDGVIDVDGDDNLYKAVLPMDIIHTANRLITARIEKRPFKIAFGGYSVTVGRGNYFHQSYPFVMERILSDPMKMLGIDLDVRNAAIGGIPSFPYGWCLKNFLGSDADVVSWDYSMNESGGVSEGIEAYLRQTLTMSNAPMFIAKDTHLATKRKDIIRDYVLSGNLKDPIIIHTDPAAEPFLKENEEIRPPGFQEWRKFGAPKGAPGQARHHPSQKEHELIGWMLAMHFLGAMEVAVDIIVREIDSAHHILKQHDPATVVLPEPKHIPSVDSPAASLLFGLPSSGTENDKHWQMNHVSCRTSFDPAIEGVLKEVVVSGLADELDLMLPKSEMIYGEGWVLDYGEGEKKAKRKLKPFDGLGYIDSKKAYYGLPMSKTLSFWLPWEGFTISDDSDSDNTGNKLRGGNKHQKPKLEEEDATKWYKSLVICEVNEERGEKECNFEKNIDFIVGGQPATNVTYIDATGVTYLKKKVCVNVGIPEGSKISRKDGSNTDSPIGLSLDATSKGFLLLKDGPCSISHVVWEEKTRR